MNESWGAGVYLEPVFSEVGREAIFANYSFWNERATSGRISTK